MIVSVTNEERFNVAIHTVGDFEGFELTARWREGDGWATRRERYETAKDARAAKEERIAWIRTLDR